MTWAIGLVERHAQEFLVSVTKDLILDYCRWSGQTTWLADEEGCDPGHADAP